jgi:hypothetical protein
METRCMGLDMRWPRARERSRSSKCSARVWGSTTGRAKALEFHRAFEPARGRFPAEAEPRVRKLRCACAKRRDSLARNVRTHRSRRLAAAGAANPIDGLLTCSRTRSRAAARGVERTAAGAIPGHAGGRTLGSARSSPLRNGKATTNVPRRWKRAPFGPLNPVARSRSDRPAASIRFSTAPATFHLGLTVNVGSKAIEGEPPNRSGTLRGHAASPAFVQQTLTGSC